MLPRPQPPPLLLPLPPPRLPRRAAAAAPGVPAAAAASQQPARQAAPPASVRSGCSPSVGALGSRQSRTQRTRESDQALAHPVLLPSTLRSSGPGTSSARCQCGPDTFSWSGGPESWAAWSSEPAPLRAAPTCCEQGQTPARRHRPAAMDLFDFFRDWDLEQQW